jgi:4-hydroxy-3-methylbut-2-enyl diphosphate reductase
LQPEWVAGKKRIGVTSGASAPEVLVRDVIAKLKSQGVASVRELDGIIETITFPLPKGLNHRMA